MTLDLNAIRNRAALARSIAHGPNALWRALASADDVPALLAEVERLTEHSKTLNSVAFAIAEALGDVPPGADQVEGNPLEQTQRLIAKAERHRIEIRDAHNDLLDVRGILSPNGYEPLTPLPLVPTVAPAVQWLVDELARLRAELPWVAAEDTATIQPCQPIGCDNGYHLAGCQFADIDAAEHNGTEAGQ